MSDNVNQGQPSAQEPNLDEIIKGITEGTGIQTQEPPKPEEPKPITLNLMGQQVKFTDENEASAQLNQYIQNLQQQQQQQPPSQYVSGKEDDLPKQPQWTEDDMKEYVRLMGTNPIEAQNYVDKKRFGTEDPVGLLKKNVEESQKLQRSMAAIQFRDAHTTLPLTPQLARVLESRRQQLGVPFTYEGLEASYWSLVGTGVLPPPQPPQFQYGGQSQFTGEPINPPPSISRTNTPEPDLDFQMASRFENMSKEDLARVLSEYDTRTRRGR